MNTIDIDSTHEIFNMARRARLEAEATGDPQKYREAEALFRSIGYLEAAARMRERVEYYEGQADER